MMCELTFAHDENMPTIDSMSVGAMADRIAPYRAASFFPYQLLKSSTNQEATAETMPFAIIAVIISRGCIGLPARRPSSQSDHERAIDRINRFDSRAGL